ncbi:MAG: hypothetical protein R3281_07480 [Balneolaceae bacterium]|nr:hypothetical protein [Balneolaceae bacterium]
MIAWEGTSTSVAEENSLTVINQATGTFVRKAVTGLMNRLLEAKQSET